MRLLPPLAIALAACAAEPPDDSGGGKADNTGDSAGDGSGSPELARCFVTPGTGDFFEPDVVRCAFAPELFGDNGVVEYRVEYPCGSDSDFFFAGDLTADEEVVIGRLIVADNTCGATRAAYPVELEIRAGATVVAPRKNLIWRVSIDGQDDATANDPARVELPVAPISIEIENQLAEARFARLQLDEIELDLGELTAVDRANAEAEETEVVTLDPADEIYRDRDAPEARVIELWAPLGYPALTGSLDFGTGDLAPVELPAGSEWILDDDGLRAR